MFNAVSVLSTLSRGQFRPRWGIEQIGKEVIGDRTSRRRRNTNNSTHTNTNLYNFDSAFIAINWYDSDNNINWYHNFIGNYVCNRLTYINDSSFSWIETLSTWNIIFCFTTCCTHKRFKSITNIFQFILFLLLHHLLHNNICTRQYRL